MKYFFSIIIMSALISSCSRRAYLPGETFYDYNNFRASQKTFSTSDGDIKYIDEGKGEVLLLLHGVPSSSWLYRKMIYGLVDKGYRIIAPDMLGFGNSANPKGYELYSEGNHGKRLIELMDHIGIDTWSHAMHDAGGLWTWEMMKQAPNRVSNLILFNTIIFESGFDPPMRMKPGLIAKVSMWGYRNGVTTNMLLNKLFDFGLVDDDLTDKDVAGYKTPLKEGKTRGMYYFFSQTCNALPDYSEVMEKLDIPVMVIWGSHDEMLRWEPQGRDVIKSLKVREENIHIIDAKHFIQEEKPDEINELIHQFLFNN